MQKCVVWTSVVLLRLDCMPNNFPGTGPNLPPWYIVDADWAWFPSPHKLIFLYPRTLGNGCAQFIPPSLLSHFPPICHGHDDKVFHQRTQTTCSHTSRCHHCHYCNVDFVLSHSVTCYTNVSINHASMVTPTYLLTITCTLVATIVILER